MGVAGITAQVTSGQQIYLDGDRAKSISTPEIKSLSDSSSSLSSPDCNVPDPYHSWNPTPPLNQSTPSSPLLGSITGGWCGFNPFRIASSESLPNSSLPRERLQQLCEGLITMAAPCPSSSVLSQLGWGRPGQALGLRGTLAYRQDATRFEEELIALAQVREAGYDNVHLILPFVRSVREFKEAKQRIQQQGLDDSAGFQCWLMAEVPSVAVLLEDYVQAGVQGIAIGSHDLSQLILGSIAMILR